MRLLRDQNLSYRLLRRLADLYAGSEHIRLVGLDRADDTEIWNYAKEHAFSIVTQDEDYSNLVRLRGSPPKVVWLRCGNMDTGEIEKILRRNFDIITELAGNPNLHLVELFA